MTGIAHAKLRPSTAHRWAYCTKAPELEAMMPDEAATSTYAEEGTRAHEALEKSVRAKTRPEDPNVTIAYDYVESRLSDPEWMVLPEQTVRLTDLIWGTADLVLVRLDGSELEVVDYKHGAGVLVEVPSLQLDIYAMSAVFSAEMILPKIQKVTTTIVQPRLQHPDGPIRSTEGTPRDFMRRLEPVYSAEKVIGTKWAVFSPSEKVCQWCRAKADCPALADKALAEAKAYFTGCGAVEVPPVTEVHTLTIEQKVAIMNARELITGWLTAVEASVQRTILAGERVPGLKVVAGRSVRKWGLPEPEIIEHLKTECKLHMADFAPPKLLGPAAVEKLIDIKARNGQKKMEALKALIIKPEGAPTVVPESDPRPSIVHFETVSNTQLLD
jgi:hypothetical protein